MRCLYLLPLIALLPSMVSCDDLTYCPLRYSSIKQIDPQETKCLATAIYGEARGEAERGMQAVAYTVLNRAVKRRICDIILAPKQYSVFNNNKALRLAATSLTIEPAQKNIIDNAGWNMSVKVAQEVMLGRVPDPTKGATHYLSDSVMRLKHYHYPKWSREYTMVAVIDNHKFYKKGKA